MYASSHINPFTEKTILGASDERVGAHSLSRRQARIWVLPVPIMQKEVGEWKLMGKYVSGVQKVQGECLSLQAKAAG